MPARRLDHVGIVVSDLDAAIAFFVALGLEASEPMAIEGAWADRIIGLAGVRSEIVMLSAADGRGQLELSRFHAPLDAEPAAADASNRLGLRHIAIAVDDLDAALAGVRALGYGLVGDVERYAEAYLLCYVRGPEGVLVEVAQELGG